MKQGKIFKETFKVENSNDLINSIDKLDQNHNLLMPNQQARFTERKQKIIDSRSDLKHLSNFTEIQLKTKLNRADLFVNIVNFCISVVNIFVLTALYLDHFEYVDAGQKIEKSSNSLRWTCLFLSFSVIILIFVRLFLKKYAKKCRFLLNRRSAEPSQKINKSIYILLVLHILQPLPYLEVDWEFDMLGQQVTYSINMILFCFSMFRLAISYDLIKFWYPYTNENAKSIYKFYKNTSINIFLYKTAIRMYGFITLAVLFLLILYLFSLIFKMFEHFDGNDKSGFKYIWNVYWFLVVTMTTIGYGDFTPNTLFGRIIGIFCCLMGIFILALVVVTLMINTTLNDDELRAYNEIEVAYMKAQKTNIFTNYYNNFMSYKVSKIVKSDLAETLILQHKKSILKENVMTRINAKTSRPIRLNEFCDKIQEMWSSRLIRILRNFQEQLQTIATEVEE